VGFGIFENEEKSGCSCVDSLRRFSVSSLTLGSEIDGAIYRNKLRLSDW
jgi:hypothetical protein